MRNPSVDIDFSEAVHKRQHVDARAFCKEVVLELGKNPIHLQTGKKKLPSYPFEGFLGILVGLISP